VADPLLSPQPEAHPRPREVLTAAQAGLVERLFSPAERWGWEYQEPDALPEVFPHPRPVPYLPWPKWASELAPKMEQAEQNRTRLLVVAAICAVIGLLSLSSSVPAGLIFLAAAGVLGYLGLGRSSLLHRQAAIRQRQWMEACVESHQRYQDQQRGWARTKQAHQEQEFARLATRPEWVAMRPRHLAQRLDVYGGTAYGWEALITSAGTSLLGTGARLTIVDVSQESVAAELAQLAELRGYGVDLMVFPEQMQDVDLFAGLRTDEVRDVLVEALHSDERDASHEARSIDGRVIGELCEVLGERLTLGRISAGLRVLLRHEPPPGGDHELDSGEYRRIANLFGETVRRSMEPRMVALESRLHGLRLFGRQPDARPLTASSAQLRVLALDERGSDLVNDVLTHLLLQVLIHSARNEQLRGREAGLPVGSGDHVLLVAGADALRRRHLERLDQLSRQRGIRPVYLFRHLRDEAADLLGGGGAAIFMRLGNAREAMTAAEFIGREHKFVLHQLTRSTGESVTHTLSESLTDTFGTNSAETRTNLVRLLLPLPLSNSYTTGRSTSRAWGETRSRATGTSTSESPGQQRVYEFAIEPTTLQTLPETAVLFVDHEVREGPRARLGDCNPDIVTLPNVSALPLEP
jgi:hypothetical protein